MEFTQEESAAMRAEYGKGATDTQWNLFLSECKARNLRPGVHLVFQLRSAKEYDPTVNASVFVKKGFWITTIAALRLIAQRTGEYLGQAEEEYLYLDDGGLPTVVSNVPLPDKADKTVAREPWVVRTKVYRKGFQEPMVGVARFEAYAGTMKGSDNKIRLTDMWAKRGSEQLSKCSEALALRKAFPEEMGSLYIAEELKHEEEPQSAPEPVTLLPAPSAPVVPKVNQVPAEPTTEPRPGEEKLPTLVEIVLNKADRETISKTAEQAEKFLSLPAIQKELADRGLQVNQAAIDEAKSLKPKPRKKADPKPEPVKPIQDREDLGITQADIDNLENPVQQETPAEKEQRKAEGQAFAEDVGGATPVPDQVPDAEKSASYVARVRELVKTHGVSNSDVGKFVLGMAGKSASKELTTGNWDAAFLKLDEAAAAGALKELVKQ